MKYGIYFGAFAPFHKGHLQETYRASAENDKVLVIVDGFDGDKGDKTGLPIERLYRYVRELFADELNIDIVKIDEGELNIPEYPNGWKKWLAEMMKIVAKKYDIADEKNLFTWYVGEPEYKTELEARFAKMYADGALKSVQKVVLSDRRNVPISATEIRENPLKYFSYITAPFKKHFVKKVLLVGGPSTGKSTMVQRLARATDAEFSREFARYWETMQNIIDEDLNADDYREFIVGQFRENFETTMRSRNGVVFLDTDAIETETYAQMYLSASEQKYLKPYFAGTIFREDFDLIILLKSFGKYVDDGARNMNWADDNAEFTEKLVTNFTKYGFAKKLMIVDMDFDKNGRADFHKRYQKVAKIINNKLGTNIEIL